jgi:hypothetical protein
VQYPNDTSVVVYSLSYSGDGKIEYLTRASDTTCCDTLYRDIPMEQLFASFSIGSTGRDTVEVNLAQGHALLIDGRCVPIPSNMVWRSIYLNGQLVTKERVDTYTGQIVEQWSTTYLDNSLYDATRYQSGAPYWKAEYTFRE